MTLQAIVSNLTKRETEVAKHIATGASNKQIANALFICERTVKAHLTSIFEKLRIKNRVELTLIVHKIEIL